MNYVTILLRGARHFYTYLLLIWSLGTNQQQWVCKKRVY
jgi:hypothetical protein